MRTFLLIAPCFAPQSTVAAFRWVKLARHIVQLGYRPIVLSATFPQDLHDPSLLAAVPKEVLVFDEFLDKRILAANRIFSSKEAKPSTKELQPIRGLHPVLALGDRYWIHCFHASGVATRLARQFATEAIVMSAGPYTAVPMALRVGRKLDLPVILDFRDPYALHETGEEPPRGLGDRFRAFLIPRMETQWMKEAAHVVLNTRNALEAYRERYPFLESKSSFIRNHHDLALYHPVPPNLQPPKRFTILHTGTLRAETRLDDIAIALRRLIDQEKLAPGDIVLRQIGRFSAFEQAQIADMGLGEFIEIIPPIPLVDILHELRKGHVLLSMVHPRVVLRLAAKNYDYIAAGMPIIAITTNPEADELLAHRSDNVRLLPGDISGLVATLSQHLARFRQTRAWPVPVEPPREFSSEVAAERFATILETTVNSWRGASNHHATARA